MKDIRCVLTKSVLLFLVLMFGCSLQLHAGEAVKLDDAQLDTISAGYVELDVNAIAAASGVNPVTHTFTDSSINVGEPNEDGYVYTETTGFAQAYAKGNDVYTEVSFDLKTDEQVVSADVGYVSGKRVSHGKHKRGNNKHRNGKHKGKNKGKRGGKNRYRNKNGKVVEEYKQLAIVFVTRQPVTP